MPTAVDYDGWATWFMGRADEMSGLLTPALSAATSDMLAGGLLAGTVDITLRSALDNAMSVASKLREHADECERRAQVCRDYDTAMHEYEGRMASYETAMSDYAEREVEYRNYYAAPPSAPSRPVRPEVWVER